MKPALVFLVAVVLQISACAQHLLPPASSRNAGSRIPPDCNRPDLLANGYPVMVPERGGVNIGISLAQHEFKSGDPIKLHLWIDNASDVPGTYTACGDLQRFGVLGIQIFDQDGHRILSRDELRGREKCSTNLRHSVIWGVWSCGRNIMFTIPPHTCVTRDNFDFTSELTSRYDLPPGTYTIRLRTDWTTRIDLCQPESQERIQPSPNDLKFTVIPLSDRR